MKLNKFFLILFFILILVLWALWAGAFNIWDKNVIQESIFLDDESPADEWSLDFPAYILGVQIQSVDNLTGNNTLAIFQCYNENYPEGYIDIDLQMLNRINYPSYATATIQNADFNFHPLNLYCETINITTPFSVIEPVGQQVFISLFYTTSTLQTNPFFYEGFSYGEIVGTLFLFLTFIVACAILFLKLFKRKNQ